MLKDFFNQSYMKERGIAVVVEQLFQLPIKKVWAAITELDQMKQWFFSDIPAFEPETGFRTEFLVRVDGRSFTHVWKIKELIPGRKIRYHWSYKEYKGEGLVTFELHEKQGQTLLVLTNEGLESFPDNIPEFSRESCEAGWNYFIKESLKGYLG